MIWLLLFACSSTEKETNVQEDVVDQDLDGDGYDDSEDCNDNDPQSYPGSEEICDGIDNNCDGEVDEGVLSTFYLDADGDGFGNADITMDSCEVLDGYVSTGGDCDDASDLSYPGAEEICDGLDNDCNEEIDEGVEGEFFIDADGDGFGDDTQPISGCSPELGISPVAGDCDDTDPALSPFANEQCDGIDNNCDGEIDEGVGLTFYADADNDGYGDLDAPIEACELPEGYVQNTLDCNDLDTEISPAADEYCDGLDNDCDGDIDEDLSVDALVWYADSDNDGYGDPENTTNACTAPSGYTDDQSDCDDGNNTISPVGIESCNSVDDDCDGDIDEEGAADAPTWYADGDNDGFGDADAILIMCDQPVGYLSDNTDCDDNDDDVYPGASEVCDTVDTNCDGDIHAGAIDASMWYEDTDTDGYGSDVSLEACDQPLGYVDNSDDCDDSTSSVTVADMYYVDSDGDGYGVSSITTESCTAPIGFADNDQDCDDGDDDISPGESELCSNGIDDNCDGAIDEDTATDAPTWYIDADSDGYGSINYTLVQCDQPTGYVANDQDCQDLNALSNPDGIEICDGLDNNCDGNIDDADSSVDASTYSTFYLDADADGFGDLASTTMACAAPTGYATESGDCDDADDQTYPLAAESCADIDANCDGLIDNDADGDGYSDESCGGSDCDDSNDVVSDTCDSSCQAILDADPSAADGHYTIYLETGSEIDVYCDMVSGEGWTLFFNAPASNTEFGSAWDYWYMAGSTTALTDMTVFGKSAAYDEMPITEIRLTASYDSSEIIASLGTSYQMLDLVGSEITTCAGLNNTARYTFSSYFNTGSYFPNNYIAIVSCDGDGADLEVDSHYDASVFSADYGHSDHNYSRGDIGSEFRVGGNVDDATSYSSNVLSVWAR